MNISLKVNALRDALRKANLQAWIIPSSDNHQSEYVAEHWSAREWISGFTGSAGTAVVTMEDAALFTDGRYFLQAEQELAGSPFHLEKLKVQGAPEFIEWLMQVLPSGSQVGIASDVCTPAQYNEYHQSLAQKNITLHCGADVLRSVWKDCPPLPSHPVFLFDESFSGETSTSRINKLQSYCKEQNLSHLLISALDEIGWITNLRGTDVTFNPVFYSFLLITPEAAHLFIHPDKCPSHVLDVLKKIPIHLHAYDSISQHLSGLPKNTRIQVDTSSMNMTIYASLTHVEVIQKLSPVRRMKACKNPTEAKHIDSAMRKDGIVLTRLLMWLQKQVGTQSISEAMVADQLIELRKQQEYYTGESFSAIIGYQANGAIIHYRPEHGKCATLKPSGLLLIDSGGQYLDGTTDTTRTISLGNIQEEEKHAYTAVLKGHIDLSLARFPVGTKGVQLDAYARRHLWQDCMDYAHGTGHGVGFFMNVHEPPQGFITGLGERGTSALEPGMLTSNEPGFYKVGSYGIRIENLVLCEPVPNHPNFLQFRTVTLCPYDKNLILEHLLTRDQFHWLNAYHQHVLKSLSPLCTSEEEDWLEQACAPLIKSNPR